MVLMWRFCAAITATAPLAFLAPSKRLWIEIFIAAATFG
jgi:hypothetical protein